MGKGTQPAYELIREQLPFFETDTVMYPHIETVRQLVATGKLVKATNKAVADRWEIEWK